MFKAFWSVVLGSLFLSNVVFSNSVMTVLKSGSFDERMRASMKIQSDLGPTAQEVLLEFLRRNAQSLDLSEEQAAAIKNYVADALLAQSDPLENLTGNFIEIFEDEKQGLIFREYLIQKIPEAYVLDDQKSERGVDFLRELTESDEYIFAGTSLISLERIQRESDSENISSDEIAQMANRILESPSQAEASKVSALQILARQKPSLGREKALSVIEEPAFSVSYRISALAVLGMVGDSRDRVVVSDHLDDPEFRIRFAAKASLGKIDHGSD